MICGGGSRDLDAAAGRKSRATKLKSRAVFTADGRRVPRLAFRFTTKTLKLMSFLSFGVPGRVMRIWPVSSNIMSEYAKFWNAQAPAKQPCALQSVRLRNFFCLILGLKWRRMWFKSEKQGSRRRFHSMRF